MISVDGEDVKWRNQAYVVGLIGSRRGRPVVIKVVTVLGNVGKPSVSDVLSYAETWFRLFFSLIVMKTALAYWIASLKGLIQYTGVGKNN